ncbi:MAG TPA: M13-type metalloendopeptidase [Luteitalea sp.]|nr:M13-type metalloendopeptidase [Luteitalea sp.]
MTRVSHMLAVSLLISNAGASFAQTHGHSCLDEACTTVSLIDLPAQGGTGTSAVAPARYGTWGFDLEGMDRSVKPGDDFFRFANGGWATRTTIPADRSSYGAFAILRDVAENQVHALLEEWATARTLTPGSDEAKAAALYRAFMDDAAIEARDAAPLTPRLDAIRKATTRERLAALMGSSQTGPGASFFGMRVGDDVKDPERYTLYLAQSGLGLPDREFYLRDNFAKQKAEYQKYVARVLTLAAWPSADEQAAAIVAMETRIAEAHWSRAESRNRDKTYNPMTWAALATAAPGFPWPTFATAAGIDKSPRAVVAQNTAVPKIAAIFAETPIATLQAWQAFHTVDQAAPYLSRRFADANWEFRAKFLQGAQEQRARWKRAVQFTEGAMGEAVGRTYVARHFPPDSKARMEQLVADLRVAMRRRIEGLAWMEPATKTAALEKLAAFNVKIGYPNRWRDYAALAPRADDAYGNMERSAAFEWAFDLSRLGGKVDEEEWGMTPQTVNAYYQSAKNEIVFPAAILQPPFFDPKADPAVNYGGIGAVIGHEITHGFDDQGRKSDAKGVLRDWWTTADATRFEAQADRLGAQYESYQFPALPGLKLTARIGMGENIADLGGVLLGLEAYRLSLKGAEPKSLDGFTATQRVFLGWAQVWRTMFRDDALRQQIVNGPHSPGFIRAYAPLRNVDAWYEAFDVKPGEALYIAPEQRARIW